MPNGRTITAQNNRAGFNGSGNSHDRRCTSADRSATSITRCRATRCSAIDVVHKAALAFTRATGTMADRVMAAMEAADANGGDNRCNCGNNPLDFVPCDNKTAHVAYIAIANKDDQIGATHNDGKYFAYIASTDDDIKKGESANPVKTPATRPTSVASSPARCATPYSAANPSSSTPRPPDDRTRAGRQPIHSRFCRTCEVNRTMNPRGKA